MKGLISIFFIIACHTAQVARPIPKSDPFLQAKASSKGSLPVGSNQGLFVEKKNLDIKKKPMKNDGSLFSVNSPSAYLFVKRVPFSAGDFLSIKVDPLALEKKSNSSDEKKGDETKPTASDAGADSLTAELMAAMPNLGPGEFPNGKVLPEIQAEVIERTAEGDLIVESSRVSSVDGRTKRVQFQAKIPARIVADSANFSTKDLRDVSFIEEGDESIRRNSSSWNDEYSLRYSGFTETASQSARQLADDRKKLQEVKDRLDNKVKAFSSDRSRFSKERAKMLEDSQSREAKLAEADRLIEEKKAYISKLETELGKEKNSGQALGSQPVGASSPALDPSPKSSESDAVGQTKASKTSPQASAKMPSAQGDQNVAKDK